MTIRIVIHDVQPLPKQRPRLSSGHAYTPRKTVHYERLIAWHATFAVSEPLTGDLYLSMQFYRKGKKRADVDNLSKAIMDALNGIAWIDDRQIVGLHALVEYGAKRPGVTIEVKRVA